MILKDKTIILFILLHNPKHFSCFSHVPKQWILQIIKTFAGVEVVSDSDGNSRSKNEKTYLGTRTMQVFSLKGQFMQSKMGVAKWMSFGPPPQQTPSPPRDVQLCSVTQLVTVPSPRVMPLIRSIDSQTLDGVAQLTPRCLHAHLTSPINHTQTLIKHASC